MALVVMGITASYAQKPGKEKATAEQRAEKMANALQQKLSLTADQKQKIQQIELDRIKKNDEWRTQDRTAMQGKMEERKAFFKTNKEKMDAILTADQKKTLAASRDEMRDKMKDRRGGKGPRGPRPEKGTPPPPPANN
ncbi:hypothetical protein AQF98_10065 [Pedobacter sp. Hv1]|nr:hypothetical protein AQF98_10065 [Pedobacter sp. Hv1]